MLMMNLTSIPRIRSLIVALLCIGFSYSLYSKNNPNTIQPDRGIVSSIGDRVGLELYAIPHPNSDSLNLVVITSLPNALLNFSRTGKSVSSVSYRAPVQYKIEIKNEDGIIRYSKEIPDTINVENVDDLRSMSERHFSLLSIGLYKGNYKAFIQLIHNGVVLQTENVPVFLTSLVLSNATSKPIVASSTSNQSIKPLGNGGTVLYNGQPQKLIFLCENIDESSQISYSIQPKVKSRFTDGNMKPVLQGFAQVRSLSQLRPQIRLMNSLLSITPSVINTGSQSSNAQFSMIEIPINGSPLIPDMYEITLMRRGITDTLKSEFSVTWNTMPLSLQNIRYALDAMFYVLTDEEYESLRESQDTDLREKVYAWWKSKDPTSFTPYNEAMVEYFRRVDSARTAYSTSVVTDGMKTERGKIFILHGAPNSIVIKDDVNPVREEWIYTNSVQKKFVFEQQKNGGFRLTAIENK
jgi:GWxTD domain-containing protein